MANYNTIVVQEDEHLLPCTDEEYAHLNALLTEADTDPDEWAEHGFSLTREGGMAYLEAEESGNWDLLPQAFLKAYGELLQKHGIPYMEFGIAYTCSRLIPGSHGGSAIRIYSNGTVVSPRVIWPVEEA